jgi:Uma2 family endonuclease
MAATDRARTLDGEIIATGVSFEEYLEKYAGLHCELVGGDVIQMSPASLRHNAIVNYLYMLLAAYFALRPIGRVITQPFTQRLPNVEPKREPDLLVVLKSNPHELKETYMDGPADICIEVVSPDSVGRDHGDKLAEYERGGVGEYWIIDPIREETRFYRRNDAGIFIRQSEVEQGNYRTAALPDFVLHVPTLWQEQLPNLYAVAQAVQAMVKE